MGATYDKLRKAGIEHDLKPTGGDALKAKQILADSGLDELSVCLLQSWLGGAHDRADLAFFGTADELSAQYHCKNVTTWWDKFAGHDEILYALDQLRKIDDKAAELIDSAGNAKAKASAKKQNEEADADAKKLRDQALSAVSVGAIGIGTVVAVAAVAYLLFMASTAKGS